MSIWSRLVELLARLPRAAVASLVEAVRTAFEGDPELRRRVSFSIAMIALSAKMAKADGVVNDKEVAAFRQIFSIPQSEEQNVALVYDLAKRDIAGFEAYARQMAGLCGSGQPDCTMLEDILDGLFHIAKADGYLHEREIAFLQRVAEIFEISEAHFERILARHAAAGKGDPFAVLGLERGTPFPLVRSRYRELVAENHPDRLIGRGIPEEFVAIANGRLASINAAYEAIERQRIEA